MLAMPHAWLCVKMVLPVRIELTTSALPRMRSTTELRQHCLEDGRAYGWWRPARQAGLPPAPMNISDCGMAKSDPEREARLAAALRDNLRRRKAQSRDMPDQKKDDTQPASE